MSTVEFLNYDILDDYGWSVDDDDLFEKAADADLPSEDHDEFDVADGDFIMETAENLDYTWPFSCRVGACANCAAIVVGGETRMDMQMILSDEEVEDKNILLTCVGVPVSDHVQIVYNAKHLDYLRTRVI